MFLIRKFTPSIIEIKNNSFFNLGKNIGFYFSTLGILIYHNTYLVKGSCDASRKAWGLLRQDSLSEALEFSELSVCLSAIILCLNTVDNGNRIIL